MKRIFSILTGFLITLSIAVKADEGMWLLPLIEELNMADMQEAGIRLTAEEIYSINNSSIKDAIVIFGRGCTGEIVSADGLLFTNHHCGYDQIQQHSTLENNYLEHGFWAMSRDEELPNPDLEVRFLDHIENVTARILGDLSDTLSEENRRSKIREIIDGIESEYTEEHVEARVRPIFAGNEYYLNVYKVYKDVRLVGTPPSAIGKFGYDTDNWEWPRHTGDFSIFRVYTAPDGSPALYSPENIPLKPKQYLPVSANGVEKGDFTFILGYPGGTDRYLSSYGILEMMQVSNFHRIKIRSERLGILQKEMEGDKNVRIQYASKFSRSSNYWKYSIGQNYRLRTLNVIERKQQEETNFMQWLSSDSARLLRYGMLLPEMEEIYMSKRDTETNFSALTESFFIASELIGFIVDFKYLNLLLRTNNNDTEELLEEIEFLKKETENFFKNYNEPTDIKVTKAMFELYEKLVPPERHPGIYQEINRKFKGNTAKYVDRLFANTFFTDEQQVMEFLENPSGKKLQKDGGFKIAGSIFRKYFEEYSLIEGYDVRLGNHERLYMQGRMEMNPDGFRYPDANFTMRLTYGSVEDYSPRDAVHYTEYTLLKGVMEKEDTANFEFLVPERLKELYTQKDYGIYGANDQMPVCFITNNDITGGNSGSPVLNARGELVGLAFDGNWEAMSGDLEYEPDLQRCICVDIRYVLFIIDKYAGAAHIIDELKIVN